MRDNNQHVGNADHSNKVSTYNDAQPIVVALVALVVVVALVVIVAIVAMRGWVDWKVTREEVSGRASAVTEDFDGSGSQR